MIDFDFNFDFDPSTGLRANFDIDDEYLMEKKIRNSSFELLRILLVFMILVEHANILFIGFNCSNEIEHAIRCSVQSLCLPAVNAFVLISGWFGIKGDYKRIFPLMFQLAVCTVPVAIVFYSLGLIPLMNLDGLFNYILGGQNYWFVIDYIALVLFAPLLNVIVENADRVTLKNSLITSYLLIVPMDVVLRTQILGVEGGYSALWFIWLYLFARYVKVYGWAFVEKNKWILMVGSIAFEAVLFFFGLMGTRYTTPFILMPAICLIMIFKDWSFQNKFINYIAPATLIAYMLHMQPCFVPYIRRFLGELYNANGYYMYMLEALGLIVVLYVISVVVYRLQAWMWKMITKPVSL